MALRGRLSDARQRLTTREKQAMQLLVEGHRTREIAARLDIREVTVEFHLGNAKRKLGAPTREPRSRPFSGQLTTGHLNQAQRMLSLIQSVINNLVRSIQKGATKLQHRMYQTCLGSLAM